MAGAIKGITVEIGGNTTKLGEALKSVEKQSKSLQSELKGVNTLLKYDPSNVTLLQQKQELLTQSIAGTKDKLETLRTAQQQVQEQFGKGEITELQYRGFQREIVATENKLNRLNEELKSFGSVSAQQIAAAGEQVQDFGGKVEDAGKKLSVLSAASAAALGAAAKSAIDYETAWTGVTKTVDGTEEQLAKINQGLIDLSKRTSSSAVDIAAVAEAAGQLGIHTDDIVSFTETMVQLGDSTNLSADEAASALAKFANITQMSANNYSRLGSVIVDLGNNFATTEADIVSMATRLASTGEVTGLTESQIMALAAALSAAGIEAEAGGSAMAKLLKKLYSTNAAFESSQAVIDATGYSLRELQLMQSNDSKGFKDLAASMQLTTKELGDAVKQVDMMGKYASTAGMSIEEFRAAYGEDAVEALSLFIRGLNDTERNGKNAVEILNDMGLTEVRLSNAILAMASSGDLMVSAIQTANHAWEENTALNTEAEKRYNTTESKITQLKNTITELAVKLGDVLLPIVQSAVGVAKTMVEKLTAMNPTAQKITLAIMAIVAALGPGLIVIGKLISAVGSIMTLAPTIVNLIKMASTAFSAFNAVLLANPILMVVAAIAALIAIFVLLWNKCEWFRNFWIQLWEQVKSGFQAFLEWISPAVQQIGGFFSDLWDAIKAVWNGILESLKPVAEGIIGTFREAWECIKLVWELVQPYFSGIWEGIKAVFSVVKEILTMYFKNAWEGIKLVWNVAVSFFETIWESIKAVFSVVATFLTGYFKTAWEGIKLVWNAVTGYFAAVWNSIKGIFSAVKSVLQGDFQGAWDAIKGIVGTWANYFSGVWSSIKNVFSSVKSWFSSTFSAAWTAVKNVFAGWGTFFSGLWDQITGTFSKIGTNISEAISSSVKAGLNGVISAIEGTINTGINLINGAINLINAIPGVSIDKIGKLSFPRLAKGGIAEKPVFAEIGEDGTEAILPLERNTKWINILAEKLNAQRMPNTSTADAALLQKMDMIYKRLVSLKMVLDSGELVGALMDGIDSSLSDRYDRTARGW